MIETCKLKIRENYDLNYLFSFYLPKIEEYTRILLLLILFLTIQAHSKYPPPGPPLLISFYKL